MGFYKEIQWTVGYPFTLFTLFTLFSFFLCLLCLFLLFFLVIFSFLHKSCYLELPYAYF